MMRMAVVLWHVTLLVPAIGAWRLARSVWCAWCRSHFDCRVVADRYDRRRILLLVNAVLGCSPSPWPR
jgi:hypothetical protein